MWNSCRCLWRSRRWRGKRDSKHLKVSFAMSGFGSGRKAFLVRRGLILLVIVIIFGGGGLGAHVSAQPLADRLPASTLVYSGWSPAASLQNTKAAKMLAD